MEWKKGIVHWQLANVLCVSVPFTWDVVSAIHFISESKRNSRNLKVLVGGPGAMLMKDKFEGVATVKKECKNLEPVLFHNPLATFTTRGCPNKCLFCSVPKVEGSFKEISDFIPRPIICDNNFTASSRKHFDKVVDKLKNFPFVDFNQGLEAKKFTPYIADRIGELKKVQVRFAFDHIKTEKFVVDAINLARKKGLKNISCYMLIGFNDTPEESLYRAKLLRSLKVQIYVMRYQPLDSKKKDQYIATEKGWTDYELKRFKRYWRGQGLYKNSFEDYDHRKNTLNEGFGLVDSLGIEHRKEIYKNIKGEINGQTETS